MSNDSLLSSSSLPSSWPLSIPRVLESVLEKMNNKDLFACRLLCQSWAKEAGRIIGKRLDKNVTALEQLEILRNIQISSDISITLRKLRVAIPASFNFKDSSSQTYSTVTSLDLRCSPSLVQHFIVNIFPNLESMRLCDPYGFSDDDLEAASDDDWVKGTLPWLRNLELCLYLDRLQSVWMSLLDTLLEKATKLDSLVIENVRISTAATLICKVRSSTLKSITVSQTYCSYISEIFFTALNDHPIIFPLDTIDLETIDIDTVSKSDMKLLLTRFSSTLSKLHIGFKEMFEMNFPLGVPMKKLRTLKLDYFWGSMEWKNLPQLRKLILLKSGIEGIASSISSSPAYCHLEALHMYYPRDEREEFLVFFRQIAEYLGPQLKSLECSDVCSQSLLKVVFTHLTQLNSLWLQNFLHRSDITDKDLCGTDSLSFTPPNEQSLGVPLNEAYQRMIASAKKSNHVRGPNITNLKDLQFLSIGGSFSEVAVLHGIVQCKKLIELNLKFPDFWNTKDSIVHLLVNAGLQHLTTVKLNGERINFFHLRICLK